MFLQTLLGLFRILRLRPGAGFLRLSFYQCDIIVIKLAEPFPMVLGQSNRVSSHGHRKAPEKGRDE